MFNGSRNTFCGARYSYGNMFYDIVNMFNGLHGTMFLDIRNKRDCDIWISHKMREDILNLMIAAVVSK